MTVAQRLIDLSHPIEDGMETYRGLPVPVIEDHLSREASRAIYADGTEFHIARISMVANTGTYLDAPSHRWADGADVSDLPLDGLVDLDGLVLHAAERMSRAIGADAFAGLDAARASRPGGHRMVSATGGPMRTSPATRSSPATRQSTCATPARSSSESTR